MHPGDGAGPLWNPPTKIRGQPPARGVISGPTAPSSRVHAAESTALQALFARAWTLRYGAPLRLSEVVPALASAGAADPLVSGMAAVFDGHQALAARDPLRLKQSLAAAERHFTDCAGHEGPAARLELTAAACARRADFSAALAALTPALNWLDTGLSPPLVFALLQRQGLILEFLGRFDDALRIQYRAIAAARDAQLPALVAAMLGGVGGLQSSMLNLDDALPLCEEAWSLCEAEPWPVLHSNVGTNLLMVLSGLGRHDEAVPLAHRLLAIDAQLPATSRSQRLFLIAQALARAGQTDRAQACLDLGRDALAPTAPPRAEWAWTQANICNRRGEPAEALRIVQDYATSDAPARYGADYPIDTAQLCAEAARACESLGDFEAALRHERRAAAARETSQRQAAHARRLTLQIEYELDAAHRQRDAAVLEQARLADLNAALESADQSKTRFLAAASHDLRQPVHALALQAAALRHELATPRQLQMLAGIERCVDAMSTMFDILLDLSRIDAGALQPQWQQLDIPDLLLRLVDEHAPAADAKGLRLALRIGRGGGATCSDVTLLETVLRNLIGNAIKYTPEGSVLVCARRWRDPVDGEQWRLQVWDTGIGIAASDVQRVFDEFYQVGNAARSREQGLGLGLAIVQRFARLLDHPLRLRSVPARGSCFELRVPAVAPRSSPPKGLPTALQLAGLHVAVIEDDPDVRSAMTILLEQWGCCVSVGKSADEVLRALAEADAGGQPLVPLGAVIADFSLPGGRHGAQEVERLRIALHGELPALIVTGHLTRDTLAELTDRQLPWLPKPVPLHRLVAWLIDVQASRMD